MSLNFKINSIFKILFEIDGVAKDLAEEAFELASATLPNKNKFVKRLGN